jgi:hypothetical protein
MLENIVYQSSTGFTQRYAEMLSAATGMKVQNMKEAFKKLSAGTEVIFMTSMMAGRLNGLSKAQKHFDIKAIVGVGMSWPSEKVLSSMIEANKLNETPSFYAQGGLDWNKLHGIKKLMLSMMCKSIVAKKDDPNLTEEDKKNIKLFTEGGDFVSSGNLKPVIEWVDKARKQK